MPSPSISLVIPTYNVARYLPDFLRSLQRQTFPLSELDLVFVDDGSTDGSGEIIRGWADRVAPDARVIRQENAGLAAARNTGLDLAAGTWVTFSDPDDMFSTGYFSAISEFLHSADGAAAQLVTAQMLLLLDAENEVVDRHPLTYKFTRGRQLVDLDRHPKYIHLQAASAFFRRDVIQDLGLRFDGRVRPNFEDGALTTRYLSHFPRPMVGIVTDAKYLYRRREDGSSLVQMSWAKPEKYTNVLEFGYLATLRDIYDRLGHVPVFAQNVVLYDLFFYFREDLRNHSATVGIAPEVKQRFHELLREILRYVEVETIDGFEVTRPPLEVRKAMIMGGKGEQLRPSEVMIDSLDSAQRLVKLRYYFVDELPTEEFRARGLVIEPVHRKIRDVRYFDKTMIYERIVWLPASGTIRVRLDGKPVRLRVGAPFEDPYVVGPVGLWTTFTGREMPLPSTRSRKVKARRKLGRWKRLALAQRRRFAGLQKATGGNAARSLAAAIVSRLSMRTPLAKPFANAWLLMDRDNLAQDNAEHLYRYLRAEKPEVNAWFVVSRDSSDWDRLSAEGFRLVPFGSLRHKLALLSAAHVASSQVDAYVIAPLRKSIYGEPRWKFTFLQHGVTHNDLSRWINPKPIDRLITATPDEQEGIVGDHTSYVLTTKETKLTGFPRHDRLMKLGLQHAADPNRLLLVMPTWRRELLGAEMKGGNARQLLADFWSTPYATAWSEVLRSRQMGDLAEQVGWRIGFMPHPNMQDYLRDSGLPDYVTTYTFADADIQQVLASSALMITDYSSVAFEMAYLQRPVVYYQFDRTAFFSGTHVFRRGVWSYEDDGFGPVVADLPGVLDAVAAIVERGGEADEEYAKRMAATFPFRDGQCCRRTFESMSELTRRVKDEDVYRPIGA